MRWSAELDRLVRHRHPSAQDDPLKQRRDLRSSALPVCPFPAGVAAVAAGAAAALGGEHAAALRALAEFLLGQQVEGHRSGLGAWRRSLQ
jgi:hypothetical protein